MNYSNISIFKHTVKPTTVAWNIVSALTLIETIAAFNLNLVVLIRIFTLQPLQTPFYIYITNLLLANVVYFTLTAPLDFINELYTSWWLGNSWCTVYIYGLFVITLVQMSTHTLIAVNRLWAVQFPLSYKKFNTMRFISLLCFGTWLFAHVTCLPGVIMDAKHYRLPVEDNGCNVNLEVPFQNAWMVFVMMLNALMVFVVILLFPIIGLKLKSKRKVRAPVTFQSVIGATGTLASTSARNHQAVRNGNEIIVT